MIKRLALALIGAVCLQASAALAVTVTIGNPAGAVPGTLPTASKTVGTVLENISGSTPGLALSPWTGSATPNAQYTAVLKNSRADYNYATDQKSFSVLWGSVDSYNKLFFVHNGSIVQKLTGIDLKNSYGVTYKTDALVTVTGLIFDRIVFASTGYSFEFAALDTQPVPLPAGLGLMLAALGGTGLLTLRRRRSNSG
ncbi:MAG: hypothetical protein D6754_00795 [Alphaproteobacteria bacterium]|nr:MAG: hypothetical protein D6754_00795 [Alphaproteobacteria bacterium]